MTRIIFVAAAAVALLVVGQQSARAGYYGAPWCAVVSTGAGDVHWSCEYRSIEECRPNVLAGNRGWCNPESVLGCSATRSEQAVAQASLAPSIRSPGRRKFRALDPIANFVT